MIHLPLLIQDLGFILITAAIVTLLFKKLKQPVVLGYLIAGFLVGPHVPFVPTVADTESIKVWAEIGVIFLLFGLGLEFSFKKLSKVGKSASITALVEIFFMLGVGYIVGQLMGWSKMDSLFLGGILSISSTTIIVRAFDELGMKSRNFVSLVFGILIVEDLVAILLLVLLSSVAVSQSFSGSELLMSSGRLVFFMVLWFVVGIYVLPVLLRRIREMLSDETMLIVSIALCLLMVMIATHVGFSPALGAFVMGSLLAETREGHRIEYLLIPVRDLFAAVFFVSVGMMIDPQVLRDYFGIIVLMTVTTVVGKLLSTTLGAVISGRSLKHSVQAGMSLAQIGEFSFIIATLGVTLKVTSDFLYPIAVAVSAVTTFTTPYLIKFADPFFAAIEKRIPERVRERLARYESAMSSSGPDNTFSLIWREYGMKIVLNSVIVLAITLLVSRVLISYITVESVNESTLNILMCLGCLILCFPFLWAIVLAPPSHQESYDTATIKQLRKLQFGLSMVRFFFGILLIVFVIGQFASISALAGVVLLAISIGGFYFSRYSEPLYQAVEHRFMENLTEKERGEMEQTPHEPHLAPWDATLAELVVSAESPVIAKTLQELALKEKYGVTIAMIKRGNHRMLAPTRGDMLLPSDRIFVIGTDDQITHFKPVIETRPRLDENDLGESFGLGSLLLQEAHPFANKTIRECGLREILSGLIVGIERAGRRILNPDSSMQLEPGDLVWIVGDQKKLKALKSQGALP